MSNDDLTSEAACQKLASLAETVGCAVWPVEDCLAEPEGPQTIEACLPQYHAVIDCAIANSEACFCEDDDNSLDCELATDMDGACYDVRVEMITCIEANLGD